jgi:hypothetical protein
MVVAPAHGAHPAHCHVVGRGTLATELPQYLLDNGTLPFINLTLSKN